MNDEMVSQGVATPEKVRPEVVRLEGDLVAAGLPALRSKLKEMVAAGVHHLTIDMAGAHLVDSAGIGLLISAHNSLKKAGGGLTVIHASKDVMELFRTMRIHQHFTVSGS
jgi:anti-anti-sigma factor